MQRLLKERAEPLLSRSIGGACLPAPETQTGLQATVRLIHERVTQHLHIYIHSNDSARGLAVGSGVRVLGSNPDSATSLETLGKRVNLSELQPPGYGVGVVLPSQDWGEG